MEEEDVSEIVIGVRSDNRSRDNRKLPYMSHHIMKKSRGNGERSRGSKEGEKVVNYVSKRKC